MGWFYAEKGNKYFEKKSVHKYTRAVRGQKGIEVKNMTDQMLVKKNILRYMQDLRAVKGMCCIL